MKSIAVLALAVLLAPVARAQQTFSVNPDASTVSIKLNTTHEVVNGTFHVQSGSIRFDRAASRMSGTVVVGTASGKTGNEARDNRMKKEILKVEQFSTVSFAPQTYTGTLPVSGDSTIQVSGVFTLLGTAHDLTIPMQVNLEGSKAMAKAQFVIPYVQWGLKDPSLLIWRAEKTVQVTLDLAGDISK